MDEHIEVSLAEVRRVFDFLEKANALLHQPMRYRDPEQVESFAAQNYPELRDLYYRVVWNWLPVRVQEEIIEG